jgi:TPR repeat protein
MIHDFLPQTCGNVLRRIYFLPRINASRIPRSNAAHPSYQTELKPMLHHLILIKVAVMASALGLNTAEWIKPSEGMKAQVQKLEDAIKMAGKQEKADEMQKMLNEATGEIKKLADSGDKDAQFSMGLLLSNQQGQADKVVEYYTSAAKQGQLQAMNNLGYITAASSREPEKQKEGVKLIKQASDGGLNAARRNMAQVYLNGMGGEARDVAAAEKLLTTAANEGDSDSTYLLPVLSRRGRSGKAE